VGRDTLVAEAEQFLANAVIQDWSVTDLEVRQHGDVAVCSYRWTERAILPLISRPIRQRLASHRLAGLGRSVALNASGCLGFLGGWAGLPQAAGCR
jgi:hypothetical protein